MKKANNFKDYIERMKAKEKRAIQKTALDRQPTEPTKKIILNEKIGAEQSKIFNVQRDDSPLRTLFGYGKSKNVPGFHSKTPSSNQQYADLM